MRKNEKGDCSMQYVVIQLHNIHLLVYPKVTDTVCLVFTNQENTRNFYWLTHSPLLFAVYYDNSQDPA